MQSDNLAQFTNISKVIAEKQAPLKERYTRYNQPKFVNKNLQKANMNHSKLLHRYRKEKTEATKSTYKRQRTFCVKVLKNTKKEFTTISMKNLSLKINYFR